ncbi:GDSL-type esterase/lipase family protein [Chitinilyticum piscinae]|uniref:SGNH hydrolase-type esterase domain-containing protein n=1 Tax=Chitinilyticum piscinae TaxID=2866724 RepID=A0A8J7FJ57_9NEIS|nr:GDSL-type esterase/lipase family protein [Chitinilyticum piscinae]MBE9608442.1 hypothetical protein [Chitinilyticum piscinae]
MIRHWLLAATFLAGPLHAAEIIDYGDLNAQRVWRQFAALESGNGSDTVRILQLGDSHTAGEYFTHAIRERLQARFGDAGYGWLTPGYVTNQRSALVFQRMKGDWQTQISRSTYSPGDFPVGGIINRPAPGAEIEIAPKTPLADGLWRLSVWTRSSPAAGGWTVTLPNGETRDLPPRSKAGWDEYNVMFSPWAATPIRLRNDGNGSELGGLVLDRLNPGVSYDSLGIVGAQVRVLQNWNPELLQEQLRWRKPDLIVLAYGTNEAFDPKFVDVTYRAELRSAVRMLKRGAPEAAILLVGAPSSAKKGGGVAAGCEQYGLAPNLLRVQQIQREIANQEHLLYWDWADAMGGNCAIQNWASRNPPLARPDLVHLSPEGYEQSGVALYDAMMRLYGQKKLAATTNTGKRM